MNRSDSAGSGSKRSMSGRSTPPPTDHQQRKPRRARRRGKAGPERAQDPYQKTDEEHSISDKDSERSRSRYTGESHHSYHETFEHAHQHNQTSSME